MIEGEFVDQYLSVLRFYTTSLGIWPFDNSWKKYICASVPQILCFVTFSSLAGRAVINYSFATLTQQVPFMCASFIMSAKHANYFLKISKFDEILTNMIHDWREEKTKGETMIMSTYAKRGVWLSSLYQVNIFFTVIVLSTVPAIPRVMDLILPLNESRPRLYPYEGFYFVNPDDYYYSVVAFNVLNLLVSGFIFVGCDIYMIHLMQHACGLLMVTGHRFKCAGEVVTHLPGEKNYTLQNAEIKQLRAAFTSHSKAIQLVQQFLTRLRIFVHLWEIETCKKVHKAKHNMQTYRRHPKHLMEIESVFAINLVFQIFVMIMALSLTLYEVAMNQISLNMCRLYAFFISQTIHMLFLNVQGQFVMDSHDNLYNMIYEATWYKLSPTLQLWYVIALRGSLSPPILTIGGLMPLNLNSFSELLKVCVSYYTVLKSS